MGSPMSFYVIVAFVILINGQVIADAEPAGASGVDCEKAKAQLTAQYNKDPRILGYDLQCIQMELKPKGDPA